MIEEAAFIEMYVIVTQLRPFREGTMQRRAVEFKNLREAFLIKSTMTTIQQVINWKSLEIRHCL